MALERAASRILTISIHASTVIHEVDKKFKIATSVCVTRGLIRSSMSVLSLHVGSLDREVGSCSVARRCNNNNECIGEKIAEQIQSKNVSFRLCAHMCMQPFYLKITPRCKIVYYSCIHPDLPLN